MTEQQGRSGGMTPATAFVGGLRRRVRAVLVASAWLRAAALLLACLFALGAIDYLFRLPRGVRVLHLGLLAFVGFELWRRLIRPASGLRPSLADVALRIERVRPEARGRLASGVDLAQGPEPSALSADLVRRASASADEIARSLRGSKLVRTRDLARAGLLLAAVVVVAGGAGLARPELARVGLARTIWPFARIDWPKRTMVRDATLAGVHPIGEALPLRALLTKSRLPMGKTDVRAAYRVLADGVDPRIIRVMLTSQNRLAGEAAARGELFERLVEPDVGEAVSGEIEYWFETEDDRTDPVRLRLAARPSVASISARVDPPAYAAGLGGAFLRGDVERIVPDSQGVATLNPVLAGSTIRVTLRLASPASLAGGALPAGWTQPDAATLVFERRAEERERAEVSLVSEGGLESVEPLVLAFEVLQDAPAAVTVVEPAYDESVLPTAAMRIAAEGRDDFGVRWLSIERQLARRAAGSEGAAPEPLGEPVRMTLVEFDTPQAQGRAESPIDLATIGARAGDEVWITARGRDVFAAPEDGGPDARVATSALRRLRVIDEATFAAQIRGELTGVRKAAIEIDTEQRRVREAGAESDAPDRQAALTQRLQSQDEAIGRLLERAVRNGLADETLTGMLDDASRSLTEATRDSDEAAQALDAERADEAVAAQDAVREELESLIAMLDQGQDNWVARRTVESLLAEQRSLIADTASLGQRTTGQALEQLSPEDLSELERIAARQRDAAERARQALDTLTDRSEQLRKIDPGQAEAMSRAAKRGRQDRVTDEMRQAAAQVGENQTRAAAQGQQAAAEALEQMLEDMDSAAASRDVALRRVLASVMDSLEGLIGEQERQITALAATPDGADLPALGPGMVALATNTLGLIDEIGPQRDLASVVAIVGLASEAQERAVGSLRDASAESAGVAEDQSLSKLREAKAEAERLNEDAAGRESARQRSELRKAYRDLLEQQVAIADETAPLLGAELDRRGRATVRALGQREQGVRESLTELRRSTKALEEAAVFELAHDRLDAAAGAATDRLLAGEATEDVGRRQATIVRVLRSLIEAMAEQKQDPRFRDQQAGAGGGGGGGSGGQTPPIIPDLAELKLLRAMQAEAMEWTRNTDEAASRPDEAELTELAGLQRELASRGAALVEKLTKPKEAPSPGGAPQ
ncbi:MAG: hypothetical protein IPJ41_06610 [Phycisphaerales bacterium]|nr:hypothetical protein [Phycisphaerales bacterium]